MKNLRETLEDIRADGRRILVVGLGSSGIESARFLGDRGLKVVVVEKSSEEQFRAASKFCAELPSLQTLGVEIIFGVDGERVAPHLTDIALTVLSPGVPLESSIVGTLRRHGIPYVAELELGIELHHGKALVVTGSNGKSTTSSLIDHILRRGGPLEEYSTDQVNLLGLHNRYNMAAAILVARHMGVSQSDVQAGLVSFLPLEHRLEIVHRAGERVVINDSKSTTVAASLAALSTIVEHYPSSRVVLMIGGLSKAGSWAPLFNAISANNGKSDIAVVCFGKDGALLANHCRAAGIPHTIAPHLSEATSLALSMIGERGIALLSPGCASFDAFNDFEHRGAAFKACVREALRGEGRVSL